MALSQPERIQISGEQLDLPLKVQSAIDTQAQLAGVKADLQAQDSSLKIFFDKYNVIANHYQTERRWVDGTTYSTIIESDLINAAQRLAGNKFFPTDGSWTKFQPQKHPSSEGLPTSSSPNSELAVFNATLANGGLTALLDFLLNGQASGVADDTLAVDYTPGSGMMEVTTGGQTPGKLLLVEGGGFSGLFLVNTVMGMNLTVTEVIPPDGLLPMTTSNVLENIPAFTNSERNTLTSALYQNVLTNLATKIIASVLLWETAINNQRVELVANADSRSPQAAEIVAAIADIDNAKSIIDAWQAFPDTGTLLNDSKFVDVNITPLQAEVTARTTFSGTRNTQITTALGSITQAPAGTYSGTGIYFLRFAQIDSRINLAGGPLTEFYEKDMANNALQGILDNANNRLATFGAELRTEALSVNATGTTTIKVASTTGFSISDTVFVMADTLTELTGTITNIIGMTDIVLSFIVPNTYTKALKARIYKQL